MVRPSEIVRRHGIRPSKSLGQNFLVDPNTIRKILRLARVSPGDRVLEIGAGFGFLTVALANQAESVIAVEFDRGLIAALRESVSELTNVTVVQDDAMKLDYSSVLEGSGHRMISNLPYNLATPLVARLLESVPAIDDFVVMVQREVGERLVAPPGSKTYGAISVVVRYFAEGKLLSRVPATVFWPKPKVESVIVHLVRRSPPVDLGFAPLSRVVHAAFGQRRKTIRNSLAAGLPVEPARVEGALVLAGIDPRVRAEMLSLEDFARIAEELS